MNYNVVVSFAYRICDGLVSGIWASSVLSNYISSLEGGGAAANEKVGLAQAIQGTLLAASAIPAGWLASRIRNDTILRCLALGQMAAIAVTSYALLMDSETVLFGIEDSKFFILCIGLGLWGIAAGNTPVLDALLANSVPTGKRLPVYTRIYICYILSQGLGPMVGAAIFYKHGNVWSLQVMEQVMLIGMVAACIPTFLLFFFNDDKSLGVESEGLLSARRKRPSQDMEGGGLRLPLLGGRYEEDDDVGTADEDPGGNESDEQNLVGFDSPIDFTPISSPFKADEMVLAAALGTRLPRAPMPAPVLVDSFEVDFSETDTVYSGSSRASSGHPSSIGNRTSTKSPDIIHRELAPVVEVAGSPSKVAADGGAADGSGAGAAGASSCAGAGASSGAGAGDGAADDGDVSEIGDRHGAIVGDSSHGGNRFHGIGAGAGGVVGAGGNGGAGAGVISGASASASSGAGGGAGVGASAGAGSGAGAGVFSDADASAGGGAGASSGDGGGGDGTDGEIVFWNGSKQQLTPGKAPARASMATPSKSGPARVDICDDSSTPSFKAKPPGGRSAHATTTPVRGAAKKLAMSPAAKAVVQKPPATASGPAPLSTPPPAAEGWAIEEGGKFLCLDVRSIPYIMAFSDCLMALASGMTIKFFPIFFKDEVHLSPAVLNLMYTVIPLSLAFMSALSQLECKLIGRVITIVINRLIGIGILYFITLFPSMWSNAWLIMPSYILRFSIMNANYPVQKSILMDWVPKKSRAAWSSVESIAIFGWSGSAAVGGWLIAVYGFQTTFFITATMQLAAWSVSTLLIPIVPSDKKAAARAAANPVA